MPLELQPGLLYVSKEFGVAGHLCACGCGNKIITPIGRGEWTFSEFRDKPTLYPSIGNWQLACRSHYWIRNGEILWSYQWSDEQIAEAYKEEELKRQEYFEEHRVTRKKLTCHLIQKWFKSYRNRDH